MPSFLQSFSLEVTSRKVLNNWLITLY